MNRNKVGTIFYVLLALVLSAGFFSDMFLRGFNGKTTKSRFPIEPIEMDRARAAIQKHGCASCHVIPGIDSPRGRVGPKLEDLKEQIYIGGILPNTPANLKAWIIAPEAFSPNTAMPNLGVTLEEAEDIATFLYQASD